MCSMFFHTNKPFELSSPSLLYGSYVLLNTDVTRSFSLGGTEQSPKNPNVLQNKKTTHLREISYKEQKKSLPVYCFTAQNPRAIQPFKLQTHQQFGLVPARSFTAQHSLPEAKAKPGQEHSNTALSSVPPISLMPLPVSSCTVLNTGHTRNKVLLNT